MPPKQPKRRTRVRLVVEYWDEKSYLVSWRVEDARVFDSFKEFVKGIKGAMFRFETKKWTVPITPENTQKLKNKGFKFIGEAYFIAHGLGAVIAKEKKTPPRKPINNIPNEKIRNYQIEGAEMLKGLKGIALLADPPGAGKTAQVCLYLGDARPFPAIIVCPAGLKVHWGRELKKWAGLTSYICEGETPEKKLPERDCYIINYDILHHWKSVLKKAKPNIVVSDECQLLITPTTIRSKTVIYLTEISGKFIAISGTPLKSRAREFFTVLSILDPGTFTDFDAYLNRYCDPKNGFFGVTFDGTSNASELHNLISPYMIRRKKIDILPELPPLQRICVPLNLTQRAKIDMLENGIRDDDAISQKLAEELYSTIFEAKAEAVFEWLDIWLDSNPGEKIVVAAYHIYVLKALMERYKKISLYIDGGVAGSKRQGVVDSFNQDPKYRILITQIIAGGVGFSASAAHSIALAELWYVPGDLEQVENRIHRADSEGDNFIAYYLVASDTIEERIIDKLNEKQEDVSEVLDGERGKRFIKKGRR